LYVPLLGQPVAWCISDREDAAIVETFLQAVKNRAGDCNVQVVMTDDGKLTLQVTDDIHVSKHCVHQTTQVGLLLRGCSEDTLNTYCVTGILTSMFS